MAAKTLKKLRPQYKQILDYTAFDQINGWHPMQDMTLGLCVNYAARPRKNATIRYFNFELAKEMGLITHDHPDDLTPDLTKAIIDTFSIQIINEHDIIKGKIQIPADAKTYMATRYLQLQHPNKIGLTSGDGRSIWNGILIKNSKTWDISSCGTGATCLSPAAANHKKFFRTGDPSISYGCGYSDLDEGYGNALFSEVLHKNGIPTERTLAVLEYPNKLSINVRASECLLRPSHFFVHLKQRSYERLKAIADLLIMRMHENKSWNTSPKNKKKYQHMGLALAKTFGKMIAQFESEYIFCWLEWDGDNILCDGKIIDYGSIRQFGLYHHKYRYDDIERFSTTITEQRLKARYIIQQFEQVVRYLETNKLIPLNKLKNKDLTREFDRQYQYWSHRFLLYRIGFDTNQQEVLMKHHFNEIKKIKHHFSYFEKATSKTKLKKTADGITKDALFCMRDFLREFPKHIQSSKEFLDPKVAMKILRSKYCSKKDSTITSTKKRHLQAFEKYYRKLITACASRTHTPKELCLAIVAQRSLQINRSERVTGDAISHVQDSLLRKRKQISFNEMTNIFNQFVLKQMLNPDIQRTSKPSLKIATKHHKDKLIENLQAIVRQNKSGL